MTPRRRSRRGSERRANIRRSRRLLLIWVAAAVLAAVGCLAWVGTHAVLSQGRLAQAQASAPGAFAAFSADPTSASASAALRSLDATVTSASELVGDPLWIATESIPFVGDNLRAYRLTVTGLSEAVGHGLVPVAPAIGRLSAALSLTDGSVDLTAVSSEATTLSQASTALNTSVATLDTASSGLVIEPLAKGTKQARALVKQLDGTVAALATATRLLPDALGGTDGKHYGLLFANNAELRTTGGIAGALSDLTANGGVLALGDQLTPADLNPGEPLAPTTAERALFGTRTGSYIQDVDLTPDFRRTGELAAGMWRQSRGTALDGVVVIDAVSVSRLLNATGPVTVDGVTLTGATATEQLLNTVYLRLKDPSDQDAFFAAVTRAVYEKVLHGGAPVHAVLDALRTSADEGRVSVWLADPSLQKEIAGTAVSGPLGRLSDAGTPVGVFLNDGTGAKMSFYLQGSATADVGCTAGRVATIGITTRLTSTAPAGIADGPWYLTGGGAFVPAGITRTQVVLTGVPGLRVTEVKVDGKTAPVSTTFIDGHPVAAVTVDLHPGASALVAATFRALPGTQTTVERVLATPTAGPFALKVSRGSCR